VAAALFHFYTAGYGTLEPRLQRAVHLLFLIPLGAVAVMPAAIAGGT